MSHSSPYTRRRLVLVAAVLFVAVVFQWAYGSFGHRIITAQYERRYATFLYNIIPEAGPHQLAEYWDRADVLFLRFQLIWVAVSLLLLAAPAADPMTARIYAACRALAATAGRHHRRFLAIGALTIIVSTSAIAYFVLLTFPNSGDEYSYLYQAQTLAAGRLWNAPHPLQSFFETNHIVECDHKLFGVFPPGWPLVLALMQVMRFPPWLVNPLLGAALFSAVFGLARRIDSEPAAVLAASMMALSNFFLMTSASYFSHTLCALLIVMSILFFVRLQEQDAGRWNAVAAGAALGFAVITRYYTPLLCVLPVAMWSLGRRWHPTGIFVALGAAPPIIFLLLYNAALTGNPFVLSRGGSDQYERYWFASNMLNRSPEILLAHLSGLVYWTPPALLLIYLLAMHPGRRKRRYWIVGSGILCLVLGLLPYVGRGDNQYGPRLYFDGFPLLVVAAGSALCEEATYREKTGAGRLLFYLFIVGLVAHVPIAAHQMRVHRQIILERMDLYRQVEARGLTNAIVFVGTPVGSLRRMMPLDLTRNGIDQTAPVLYAIDRGESNPVLIERYPERACFDYRYDTASRRGRLTACDPRR